MIKYNHLEVVFKAKVITVKSGNFIDKGRVWLSIILYGLNVQCTDERF